MLPTLMNVPLRTSLLPLALLCGLVFCESVSAEDPQLPQHVAPAQQPAERQLQAPVPIRRHTYYGDVPVGAPPPYGVPYVVVPPGAPAMMGPAFVPGQATLPGPYPGQAPGPVVLPPGVVLPEPVPRTPSPFLEGSAPEPYATMRPVPDATFDPAIDDAGGASGGASGASGASGLATLPLELGTESGSPYSVELIVTEAFVNRLVQYRLAESGPVREVIQGADVTGWQVTDGSLNIDFQPSETVGTVELVLSGQTQSDTLGRTPQATIKSLGLHHFVVSKPILIGEWRLMTRKTSGRVLPSTTHVGARTPLSDVPLLGELSGRIAYRAAQRRRTAAEIEAGQKLLDRMLPRMDDEVDSQLARVNLWQRDQLPAAMKRINLAPASSRVSSSDDALRVRLAFPPSSGDVVASEDPDPSADVAADGDAVAAVRDWEPPAGPKLRRGDVSLAIHENLANRLLEDLEFPAIRIPDERISELWTSLGPILNDLMQGRSPQLPTLEEIQSGMGRLAVVEVDSSRPIRWQFREGEASITLFVTFYSTIGARLGEQEVTIPFSTESADGQITLKPGRVRVTPVQSTDALGFLVQSIIRQQITQRIKNIEFQDTFRPTSADLDHIQIRLASITADRGWLQIVITAEPQVEQTVQR